MNTTMTPRQTFNQQREAAQVARQTAYRAAMQMQDVAKRRAAREAARLAFKDTVGKARQTFNVSKGNVPTVNQPKKLKSGGSVSASKRADGCAVKGKTRGRIV